MTSTPTTITPDTAMRSIKEDLKPKSVKFSSTWYSCTHETSVLRQLPICVKPFVIGLVFPSKYMRPLAEAICSPELISERDGNHFAALHDHMYAVGKRQTFVPTTHPDSNEPAYLWTRAVLPGYNGRKPGPGPLGPSPEIEAMMFAEIRSLGLGEDFVQSLKTLCLPWPAGIVFPYWLPTQLERAVLYDIEMFKAKKRKQRRKQKRAEAETKQGGSAGERTGGWEDANGQARTEVAESQRDHS